MNIKKALEQLYQGKMIRQENFPAGCYCMATSDGKIYDPEMGITDKDEFLKYYKHFTEDWYVY